VERRLATLVGDRFDYKTLDEKREKLLAILKKVVVTSNRLAQGTYIIGEDKIYVSRDIWTYLEYTTIRDMAGMGKLEPMIRDPYIEDISIPGAGPVFLEHKVFEACESSVTFELGELKDYAERVSQIIGRPVSLKRPITDGSLPDGSRINIVYAGDVSLRGPNITIRRFSPIPLSIVELCRYNSLDYTMAAYLWMLLDNNHERLVLRGDGVG
jgi:archaeal flagellar protein FlaI